jgi:hypothetical protein
MKNLAACIVVATSAVCMGLFSSQHRYGWFAFWLGMLIVFWRAIDPPNKGEH